MGNCSRKRCLCRNQHPHTQQVNLCGIEREKNLIIRQINRKFGQIDLELETKIRSLNIEIIEALGESIFDLDDVEDYLRVYPINDEELVRRVLEKNRENNPPDNSFFKW